MSWQAPTQQKQQQQLWQWTPSPALYRTASPATPTSLRSHVVDGNSASGGGGGGGGGGRGDSNSSSSIFLNRYCNLPRGRILSSTGLVATPRRTSRCVLPCCVEGLSPLDGSSVKLSVPSSSPLLRAHRTPTRMQEEKVYHPFRENSVVRPERSAGGCSINSSKTTVQRVPLPFMGVPALDLVDWKIARRHDDIGALVEILTLLNERERRNRLRIKQEADLLYNCLKRQAHDERDAIFLYRLVLPVVQQDLTPSGTPERHTPPSKSRFPDMTLAGTLFNQAPLDDRSNFIGMFHGGWEDETFATHPVICSKEVVKVQLLLVDEEMVARKLISIAEEGCRRYLMIKVEVANDGSYCSKGVSQSSNDVLLHGVTGEDEDDGDDELTEASGKRDCEGVLLGGSLLHSWRASGDMVSVHTETIDEQLWELLDDQQREREAIERAAWDDEMHILDVERLSAFLISEEERMAEMRVRICCEEQESRGAMLGQEALGAARLAERGTALWHMRRVLDAIAQRIENMLYEEEASRRCICGDIMVESGSDASSNSSINTLLHSGSLESSMLQQQQQQPAQRRLRQGSEQRERTALWNVFHVMLRAAQEAELAAVVEAERQERVNLEMAVQPKYVRMLLEMELMRERQVVMALEERNERNFIEYDEVRRRVDVQLTQLGVDMDSIARDEEGSEVRCGRHGEGDFVLDTQPPGSLFSTGSDYASRSTSASLSLVSNLEEGELPNIITEDEAEGAAGTSRARERVYTVHSLLLDEQARRKLLVSSWLDGFLNMMELDTMATGELLSVAALCNAMRRRPLRTTVS